MLPSIRHFLRFIDLDSTFDSYGFVQKVSPVDVVEAKLNRQTSTGQNGAAFKLNSMPTAFTDFIAAGGPGGYSWNVVRSEADDLIFRHAGKSGAKIFDGVKVNNIDFVPTEENDTIPYDLPNPGRPLSASWSRKADGASGVIKFDYLIDASGRAGLVSTKTLKNRRYNQGLKNVACWGYWKGASSYGEGKAWKNQPYFEALQDASGWAWSIPLHNDVLSVGLVTNQAKTAARKKEMGSPSSLEFYKETLKLVPGIDEIVAPGELVSDIKNASDWSYSASHYASPYVRVAGDAGCFIDPFFSSGVHLALASGLSAATTVCASIRGQISEFGAADWHSKKVAEGYSRFLLVVMSVLKQIRMKEQPVLTDMDEKGFDRAFAFFRPIIQGAADTNNKLTQEEISKTVDFCFGAFAPAASDQREAVLKKVDDLGVSGNTLEGRKELEAALSPEELRILETIQARQMLRMEDITNIDSFGLDVIDGLTPNLKTGDLGLVRPVSTAPKGPVKDVLGLMHGEGFAGDGLPTLEEMEQSKVELSATA
ncbi:MAG: hypothetical protein Q9167_007277 [Letrouitia subvulpina]